MVHLQGTLPSHLFHHLYLGRNVMENVNAIACFAQQAPLAWKIQVIRHPRPRLKAVSARSGTPEAHHQVCRQAQQLAGAEEQPFALCTASQNYILACVGKDL